MSRHVLWTLSTESTTPAAQAQTRVQQNHQIFGRFEGVEARSMERGRERGDAKQQRGKKKYSFWLKRDDGRSGKTHKTLCQLETKTKSKTKINVFRSRPNPGNGSYQEVEGKTWVAVGNTTIGAIASCKLKLCSVSFNIIPLAKRTELRARGTVSDGSSPSLSPRPSS